MVPLYILGLLLRFGPQHGYQIKKTITENVADFAQIKLPTIYYHLEKMEREGLLSAAREQDGARPEKTVYSVTEKGKAAFLKALRGQLNFRFRPDFDADAVFYFAEYLEPERIREHLEAYAAELEKSLAIIERHRDEVNRYIPQDARLCADILFSHHAAHYRAERNWALEALQRMR